MDTDVKAELKDKDDENAEDKMSAHDLMLEPVAIPSASKSGDDGCSTLGARSSTTTTLETPDHAHLDHSPKESRNDPSNWIPHCYTTIGGCSLHFLKPMLSAIEPISFSGLSLRGLVERGKREVSKRSLTDIIEFVTALDSETPLNGDMKFLPKLHFLLGQMSIARGRKGRDLRLPPDWLKDGYYRIVDETTEHPKVEHRYLGLVRALPMHKFQGGHEEIADARIDNNFSELRASISTIMGLKILICSQLFSDVIAASEGVVVSPDVKSQGQAVSVAALSTKPSSFITPKKDAETSPCGSPQPPPARLHTAQPEESFAPPAPPMLVVAAKAEVPTDDFLPPASPAEEPSDVKDEVADEPRKGRGRGRGRAARGVTSRKRPAEGVPAAAKAAPKKKTK